MAIPNAAFREHELIMPNDISNKLAIEQNLRTLRNSHRLAIHIWEQCDHLDFPDTSWGTLNKAHAAAIDESLRSGTPLLLSMSLLPSQQSGLSMRPYDMWPNEIYVGGYLVDLNQDQQHAPRVVRASELGLSTGEEADGKDLELGSKGVIGALNDFYRPFSGDQKKLLQTIGGDKGKEYSEFQLNQLGAYYDNTDSQSVLYNSYEDKDGKLMEYNEIVVAAAREHVAAIAIPYFVNERSPRHYEPSLRLYAAIAGLQHLEKDIDLPVVCYKVNAAGSAKNPACPNGDCVYLAQGHQELYNLAYHAIEDLIAIGGQQASKELRDETLVRFGCDLYKPIFLQREAIEKLRVLAEQTPGAPDDFPGQRKPASHSR